MYFDIVQDCIFIKSISFAQEVEGGGLQNKNYALVFYISPISGLFMLWDIYVGNRN